MAKQNSFGRMLAIGMAAAVIGGIAAYLRRKEIEGVVQDISDALDARDDDGDFSVNLADEPIFHKVPNNAEVPAEEAPAEEAPAEEAPAEEAPAEEVPVEETPAAEESAPIEEAPGTAD